MSTIIPLNPVTPFTAGIRVFAAPELGSNIKRLSAPDKAKLGLHFLLGNHPSFPPTAKTSNFPQKAGFQGQIAEIPQS